MSLPRIILIAFAWLMLSFSSHAAPLPSPAAVLDHLYGKPGQRAARYPRNRVSSWFEQDFRDGKIKRHVYFARIEATAGAHPEEARIGAAVYRQENGAWQSEAMLPEAFRTGVFGEVQDTDQVPVLRIGPTRLAFLFENTYLNQGQGSVYVKVIGYAQGKFDDLGIVETGGDNFGDCPQTGYPYDGIADGCSRTTGTVSADAKRGGDYYDLLVHATTKEYKTVPGKLLRQYRSVHRFRYQNGSYQPLE